MTRKQKNVLGTVSSLFPIAKVFIGLLEYFGMRQLQTVTSFMPDSVTGHVGRDTIPVMCDAVITHPRIHRLSLHTPREVQVDREAMVVQVDPVVRGVQGDPATPVPLPDQSR